MRTPHLCFVLRRSSQLAELLWSASEGRQNRLVLRAKTGLEICSVNFEQLVVLVMVVVMVATASSSMALVGQGTVGQEGRETAPGLFALKVG